IWHAAVAPCAHGARGSNESLKGPKCSRSMFGLRPRDCLRAVTVGAGTGAKFVSKEETMAACDIVGRAIADGHVSCPRCRKGLKVGDEWEFLCSSCHVVVGAGCITAQDREMLRDEWAVLQEHACAYHRWLPTAAEDN